MLLIFIYFITNSSFLTCFYAERGGFEPPIRGYRIHAFQACAFDRSATSPCYLNEHSPFNFRAAK